MKHLFALIICIGFWSRMQAQNLPSYLPANGLVGWWPFNGNAQDESGNGNHGTVNGAALTTDRFGNAGKAYQFDGVDDNISIAPSSSLNNFNNSITISAWIYSVGKGNPSYGNQDLQGIFGPATWLVNDGGFLFRLYDDVFDDVNQRVIQYGNGLPTFPVFSSQVVQTNSWENITCSYDGTRIRLYRNGIKTDSSTIGGGLTSSMNTGGRFYTIGQCIDWASTTVIQAFNGKLDDIAIYNRALTQEEITQLYQAGNETSLSYHLSQEKLGNCATSPVKLSVQTSVKVKTDSAGSIGSNSATAYGTVLNDGGKIITRRGFCWDTSANPDLSNSYSENGSGSGAFSGNLNALNPSTTYYLRAYAGTATEVWYGNELSFTTNGPTSTATCGTPNIHNPNLSYGSMSDQDGNSYKTIVIGTQEWMAENLKTGHYRNGEVIPVVTDASTWTSTANGASCWYNNDSATYDCPYGRLYNWYTVADQRGLCPAGWHVPSDEEWKILESYLGVLPFEINDFFTWKGSYSGVAKKIFSNSSIWQNLNDFIPTNSTGFSILPSGRVFSLGGSSTSFYNINGGSYLWTSSPSPIFGNTCSRELLSSYNSITGNLFNQKNDGLAVRCIKEPIQTGFINRLECDGLVSPPKIILGGSVQNYSIKLPYEDGNGGSYNGNYFYSKGVNGLMAEISAGNFLSGDGQLSVKIIGSADTVGFANFQISISGKQCEVSIEVIKSLNSSCGHPNVHNPNVNYGSIVDIDGKEYKTVKIGSKTWMAENLSSGHFQNGDLIENIIDGQIWFNTNSPASCWVDNDSVSYGCKYGRLYNWYAIKDPRGLCPNGWRLPEDEDWDELSIELGGIYLAGGKMKTVGSLSDSTGDWGFFNLHADNLSGFSGLPGGRRDNNSYSGAGDFGYWWSSSDYSDNEGKVWPLDGSSPGMFEVYSPKNSGFSVRCLKIDLGAISDFALDTLFGDLIVGQPVVDLLASINYFGGNGGFFPKKTIHSTQVYGLTAKIDSGNFSMGNGVLSIKISGTPSNSGIAKFKIQLGGKECTLNFNIAGPNNIVTDIDGNLYHSVVIDEQVWLRENLRVARYSNGDTISKVVNASLWISSQNGAFASFARTAYNDSIYGKLYNWMAVNDSRGLCPVGWHVPSINEWLQLENYLAKRYSTGYEGGLLKDKGVLEDGSGFWLKPNTYAKNYSGFSGLPGGGVRENGFSNDVGYSCHFWSGSNSETGPWAIDLQSGVGALGKGTGNKRNGFSVRCLKD